MIATVRRLLALAGLPGARLVATIALGALAVGTSIWLHRKITPELLTPANAGHDHAS